MGVEWVAGLLVALAVAGLGGAALLFFRGTWFMQWLRGTGGILLVLTAIYCSLIAGSLFAYQASAGDAPIATLSFEKTGDQQWSATVSEPNGNRRVFELAGDLWELDVRILRYAGLGGLFGTAPSFQLERLATRYVSLEDQSSKDHSEHNLATGGFLGFDLWERADRHGNVFVEASRSNIALLPMADGAIFEVRLSDDGLSLGAANSAAEDALQSIVE